jgi:hypothetical protein
MPVSSHPGGGIPRHLYSPDMLCGWEVATIDGTLLGTVHQLILNVMSGDVAYVIVNSGGFLGVGELRYPLPWNGFVPMAEDRRLTWAGDAPPASAIGSGIPGGLLVS